VSAPVPFSCECPHCNQERVQTAHTPEELAQLLRSGAEIEAYCMSCDRQWLISVEERADLARALSR
jgi:redox-regulated HSP33 family molecular chaperone